MYSVQCTVYSVPCTVYSVQCTVYSAVQYLGKRAPEPPTRPPASPLSPVRCWRVKVQCERWEQWAVSSYNRQLKLWCSNTVTSQCDRHLYPDTAPGGLQLGAAAEAALGGEMSNYRKWDRTTDINREIARKDDRKTDGKILSNQYRICIAYGISLRIIIPHHTTLGNYITFLYNIPYGR